MSKLADYYCDKFYYEDMWDFAYNCGIDDDIFNDLFWEVVSRFYKDNGKACWVIWNWIDSEGTESIEDLANMYDSIKRGVA